MSGQPAARLGDAVKGSKIIQDSRTVLIGSQGGVACSECPGGVAKGSPVSVSLGAKVLSGTIDLDFALPGAMPLAWQRQYSSYVNAEHGGACGVFGYGWKNPLELQLLLVDAQAQLFDTNGRVITFEDRLLPGTSLYSLSEDIWLLRGGMLGQPVPAFKPRAASSPSITPPSRPPTASTPQAHDEPVSFVHYIEASDAAHWGAHQRWQHIPAEWVDNPHCIIATSGNGQVLWCFEPEATAPPLVAAQRWLLTGKRDALGRQQRLHYAAHLPEGQRRLLDAQGHSSDMALPAHMLVAIEDGLGRHYQLHYQCSSNTAATAWQQRQQARERALANDQPPPEWDCSTGHRGQAGWQMDSGIRLSSITLEHSPQVDSQLGSQLGSQLATQPIALVRYTYSAEGDLSAVYDRSGALVRQFQYANHLMVAHRHRQGPWHRYVYESESEAQTQQSSPHNNHSPALPGARVRIHTNEQGLSWQFDYQHDRLDPKRTSTLVTDSLGRQERYDYHGLGGLKRLARHTRADGTSIAHTYNGFGHLGSTTNALGHTSYIRRDGQGRVMGTQSAQGLNTQVRYNPLGQLSHTEDAQGIRTDYSYDRYGRLVLITTTARGMGREQEPLTQRYHYPDPTQEPLIAHLPTTITDARGGNKHLRYNSAGQQTRYSDCSGQSTYWSWDAWGQLSSTSDAQGHSQQHHYDAAGQLLGTELANGQRICNQWSEAGLLTRSWLQDSQGQAIADSEVQLHYD
ncbi:DUF6531 domain-containing protein, partial [Lampropedia aestuarii]|uniref:DUF6531 domain-containing protein n=1 Tax=Lampropedia aestuarii TaxID=2562762 RepID=UPI00246824BC